MKTKTVIVRSGLVGMLVGLVLTLTTESPSIGVSLLMGSFVISIFGLFGVCAGVLLLSITNLRKKRIDVATLDAVPHSESSATPIPPPSSHPSVAPKIFITIAGGLLISGFLIVKICLLGPDAKGYLVGSYFGGLFGTIIGMCIQISLILKRSQDANTQ